MSNVLVHSIYLKIDDKVYTGVASDVGVPAIEPVVWEGSTDTDIIGDVPVGQRKLRLVGRQDWRTADGLCRGLMTAEGQLVSIIYSHVPGAVDGVYFSVDAIATTPDTGGKINDPASFTLSLPCTKPVIVAAPA